MPCYVLIEGEFIIKETGEARTLRYHADLDLAPCGFDPSLIDICGHDHLEIVRKGRNIEYRCGEEIFNMLKGFLENLERLDRLGDHLMGRYGFELMEMSKLRSSFPLDLNKAAGMFELEYKNMIVASNAVRLKKHFGGDARAEAENLYEYGPCVPEVYKTLHIKIDDIYDELIEWAADSLDSLREELEYLSGLSVKWRKMAALGLVGIKSRAPANR